MDTATHMSWQSNMSTQELGISLVWGLKCGGGGGGIKVPCILEVDFPGICEAVI